MAGMSSIVVFGVRLAALCPGLLHEAGMIQLVRDRAMLHEVQNW